MRVLHAQFFCAYASFVARNCVVLCVLYHCKPIASGVIEIVVIHRSCEQRGRFFVIAMVFCGIITIFTLQNRFDILNVSEVLLQSNKFEIILHDHL